MSHKIIAENIASLMAASVGLRTQQALGKACGIDQRTIGRILNQEHSPSIDKLQLIADAFGIQTWQLLIPRLDPKNLPVCELTQVEVELYRKLRTLAYTIPPTENN